MKIRSIGRREKVLTLVEAIGRSGKHELTHAAHTDELTTPLLERAPGLQFTSAWDELLPVASIEAVIACGESSDVRDGVKQFAAAGIPVILFPEYGQDIELVYQLSLIRDDCGVPLLAVFPHEFSPETLKCQNEVARTSLDTISEFRVERRARPFPGNRGLSTQQNDEALLRDTALLRSFSGNYNHVTAVLAGEFEKFSTRQMVTLSGNQLPVASWTMLSSNETPKWN